MFKKTLTTMFVASLMVTCRAGDAVPSSANPAPGPFTLGNEKVLNVQVWTKLKRSFATAVNSESLA